MFQRGRYGLNQGKEEGRLRLALFICVEIIMPKGPFLPSDFTATKFSTAADKAEFGNTLLRFIESEWAPALITKSFYNHLSMTRAELRVTGKAVVAFPCPTQRNGTRGNWKSRHISLDKR